MIKKHFTYSEKYKNSLIRKGWKLVSISYTPSIEKPKLLFGLER